jgi:hypothetical protein
MKKANISRIKKDLDNIKATMAFENMKLNREEIKVCRKILKGECSGDEARQMILKGYNIT